MKDMEKDSGEASYIENITYLEEMAPSAVPLTEAEMQEVMEIIAKKLWLRQDEPLA